MSDYVFFEIRIVCVIDVPSRVGTRVDHIVEFRGNSWAALSSCLSIKNSETIPK